MDVFYTPHFKREAKQLPRGLRSLVEERLRLFISDPHHSSLKLHKLTGKLKEYWAFSIDYQLRVILSFEGKTKIVLHSIGDHSIYD
jgi:mRNA-degrading endonuclease YafQ of YafQ-DinJ toxin-antitoxin module